MIQTKQLCLEFGMLSINIYFMNEDWKLGWKKLSQLEKYVTSDSLVLATIGYGPNELSDAAIEQTPGHFVVICGWENEWIRVADPAASEMDDVLRFYNAKEFAKVWLANKNGAAYLVRKKWKKR